MSLYFTFSATSAHKIGWLPAKFLILNRSQSLAQSLLTPPTMK